MAAISTNTKVKCDCQVFFAYDVAHVHGTSVKVDGLYFVFKVEPDVRRKDGLLHELCIEECTIYGIDCL